MVQQNTLYLFLVERISGLTEILKSKSETEVHTERNRNDPLYMHLTYLVIHIPFTVVTNGATEARPDADRLVGPTHCHHPIMIS